MAFRLRRNLRFLEMIANEDLKIAKAIISNAPKEKLDCIYELLINVRYSNIPVKDKIKKAMQQKRSLIQRLTDKKVGSKARKKLLIAHLPLVISIIKGSLSFIANGRWICIGY